MTAIDLTLAVEQLAQQLVDIPSVSGAETTVANAVEDALRGCAHLEVMRDGDAVVARTSQGNERRVLIAGHLDTVPIAGNVPSHWDDGGATLYGRGTVDMKSGVAVMLSLAASLASPTTDVTWVFYDHEEVEESKNGLGRLSRRHPEVFQADFGVLCEPTGAVIEGGCNGTIRLDVQIPGKAAHSARSWKGVNAVHAAAPLLQALADYEPATVTVDGLDFREGLNAVGIRGGVAGNVIPDVCTVTVNYRFAPSRTADQAIAAVEEFVASAGVGEHSIVVTDRAESCRPGLDHPLATEFVARVSATGVGPARAKLGWTDVARLGAMGIPAVNYGPGDPELAHADNEHCPVSQMHQCRDGLAAWLTA